MAEKEKRKETNLLVIIDPQNDFHKKEHNYLQDGSLAVPGALADVERINKMIRTTRFDNIIVTLDTHQYIDIAHPSWWVDKDGKQVNPFTQIKAEDIESGKYKAARQEDQAWSLEYCKKLEAQNRHIHMVWPYHCIVGTHGHGLVGSLNQALKEWALANKRLVTFMWKGTNPKAEMYSAFKADVEVPGAPETRLNTTILSRMKGYDNIVVCGQAMSHCVRYSFTDMCEYFKSQGGKQPNCILLEDCASTIDGFEEPTKKWKSELSKDYKFVNIQTCATMKNIGRQAEAENEKKTTE